MNLQTVPIYSEGSASIVETIFPYCCTLTNIEVRVKQNPYHCIKQGHPEDND